MPSEVVTEVEAVVPVAVVAAPVVEEQPLL
jgi:hypothetical protein